MGLRRSLRRFFKAFLCGATPQDEESEKPSTPYHSYPTYPPRSAETNDQQPYIISPPPTLLAVHAHRQDHAPPSRLVTPQNQQQAALEHQRHQNALLLQHQKHQDTFLEHQRQQETNLEQQRQQAEFQEQQLEQLIQLEAQQRRQAPSQSRRPSMSRARLKVSEHWKLFHSYSEECHPHRLTTEKTTIIGAFVDWRRLKVITWQCACKNHRLHTKPRTIPLQSNFMLRANGTGLSSKDWTARLARGYIKVSCRSSLHFCMN